MTSRKAMYRLMVTMQMLACCVPVCRADVWVEGTSQPAERITISSAVEEIVESVAVEEGDVVEKDHVLATLSATRQNLEVKRLTHLIEKAEQDELTAKDLFGKGMKTKSFLLEKEVEVKRLKVEKEMAEFAVDQRSIKAPVAGTVVHRLKDPGEAIGRVEPLFEIIDASKLKLVFFLSTKHLAMLKEGMESAVRFPELPDTGEQKAKLVFIDPQVDSRSGLYRVRFEFDNRKLKIKPGLRVKVKLPEPGKRK
jgi:membrane fusion protein (multidrug efflux system)